MSKTGNQKTGPARTGHRRQEIRRNLPKPAMTLKTAMLRPEFIRSSIIVFMFLVITGLMVAWGHDQVIVTNGQLMSKTRIARLDWDDINVEATEQARKEAELSSPRIYDLNRTAMEELEGALLGLPMAVEGKTSIDELADEIKSQFQLDTVGLAALQDMSVEGEVTEQWKSWVDRLVNEDLQRAPILDDQEAQVYATTRIPNRVLLLPDGKRDLLRAEAIPLVSLEEDPQNPENHRDDLVCRLSILALFDHRSPHCRGWTADPRAGQGVDGCHRPAGDRCRRTGPRTPQGRRGHLPSWRSTLRGTVRDDPAGSGGVRLDSPPSPEVGSTAWSAWTVDGTGGSLCSLHNDVLQEDRTKSLATDCLVHAPDMHAQCIDLHYGRSPDLPVCIGSCAHPADRLRGSPGL